MSISIRNNDFQAPSWYIFDKVYPNKTTMDAEKNNDGVLIGRYVLIKYCETAFKSEEKELLYRVARAREQANGGNLVGDGGLSNEDYKAYKDLNAFTNGDAGYYASYLQGDNFKNYDRMFFRKEVDENGTIVYKEMDRLFIPEDLLNLSQTVEDEVARLDQRVNQEIENREAAMLEINSNLNTEIINRETENAELNNKIISEQNDRISSLATEAQYRMNADLELLAKFNNQVTTF